MGAVTTSLADRVTSIFDDLGYTVSGSGSKLRAERKWRVVNISLGRPESLPSDGEFHCFVAPTGDADDLYRELTAAEPPYEWAVLRITDDDEVEFLRPPPQGSGPIVT